MKYKKYAVTFTEVYQKYDPVTRTITVHAYDEYHAKLLISDKFDTYKGLIPTEKRIRIDKVKEIK